MKIAKGILLILFLAVAGVAQVNDKTMGQIESLFAGTWKMDGKETYEKWEKTDTAFKGKGYSVKDGQEKIAEYFEIKNIDGKIYYLATVPTQNNGATIKFALTKSDAGEFVFENPEHDFPKKIVYKKLSETEMFVQVSGANEKGFSFKMKKL